MLDTFPMPEAAAAHDTGDRPRQSAGSPYPLGATVLDDGVNFSVHVVSSSTHDGRSPVELCLFDANGRETRLPLTERTSGVWHTFVHGIGVGQRYGYRVAATDPAKVLLDPYARRVDRTDYDLAAAGTPGADTAGGVPLGLVTAPVRARADRPAIPWEHTVIYEGHVKGLTATHPDIPPELRGRYGGIAHPVMIEHLQRLGVTALELLPVHAHAPEPLLRTLGRPNYWGYSTLSYFAPHPEFATTPGAEVDEFATMVDALHRAGIELILDVVYNHTCEGGRTDAVTLSLRGLDPAYYLPGDADLTGTGNTLDGGSLAAVRLVTDSLRYFADDLGVDGFRFDLAPVLGRPGGQQFSPSSALLTAIAADPVLRERKLIAEPWDATGAGYSLGRFGDDWAEWNDRFRDTVRDFWRGHTGVRDLGFRLAGSEDVFADRQPWASINFVTAHDGFTLRDLVSYERKHNDGNGLHGADGSDHNRSANYGMEGDGNPTPDGIVALRTRQARNLAATVLLATGTPMICAGDEMWRTQRGNNNAYSTDSAATWIDWSVLSDSGHPAGEMLAFFRRVIAVRSSAPALHQGNFFSGRTPRDGGVADLIWFAPDGTTMRHDDWFDDSRETLMAWFDGNDVRGHGPMGEGISGDSYLLVLHAGAQPIEIRLPAAPYTDGYEPVIDTASANGQPTATTTISPGVPMTVPGRTLWLLRATGPATS